MTLFARRFAAAVELSAAAVFSGPGPLTAQTPFPGDYLVAAVVDLEPQEALDEDTLAALRPGATRVRVRAGQTETVALKLAPLP